MARGKEVLKERVCWVYTCKFGWLCEPAGWDTRFLGTAPRKVFPLPRLSPLFPLRALGPSHRPGQDAPSCVQESPRHLAGEQRGSWERADEHTVSKAHPRHSGARRQGGQPLDLPHLLPPRHKRGQFCPCDEDLASRSCPAWGLVWA